MQKDTSLLPPSMPSASNTVMGGGQQASGSEVPTNSETGHHTCPKKPPKPSMSKVIMGAMKEKGARSRMSRAALKKALTTMGFDMTRNAFHFKQVLMGLVDKGVLKQVTGRGVSGSFRLGKKWATKAKLKAKRQQRRRRRQSGRRRSGPRQSRQRRSLLGSKQGHKRLFKRARRVNKCHRN
ncbi:PREDICTED: spermatid-specific linker histone H1-like protein [Galeopterus variegatus]|uniref:Spermatid-specific linker histone H1-like protein n=1 Tax=Galeopterus variegatus TaxID=482537 RepID=A0ABM0SK89_GALVR|nr:PREDICTED: spermatid-specific linker histone H1-like protein [Galeopterus variegatus]XP_008593280.1 PREDICTED: spermatid-specific linker histone H1-like protein [Galeopterus variegatus]